jgi:hypothetical protein
MRSAPQSCSTPEMRRERALTAAFVLVATCVVAGPVAVSATGCAGDDCAGSSETWGSCTQGERVDDYTWESGPVDSAYLDFHGGTNWLLDPSAVMGKRAPVGFEAFLSLGPSPYAPDGGGFAPSAGNLTEFHPADNPWQVSVLNDTCAQYYLRVVLTYPQTGKVNGTCDAAGDAARE